MNEQRVARVRAEMQAHGLTQMIISDSKSIWYLTGASVEPYERLMALYLPVQGEPVIFLNKLFFVPQAPCREVWHTDSDKPVEQIAEVVDKTKTLGIDKEWPAMFLLPLMDRLPGCRCVLACQVPDPFDGAVPRYAGSAGFRLRGCLPRREGCRRTDADEGSIPHQR